jgi:hypothetical protein
MPPQLSKRVALALVVTRDPVSILSANATVVPETHRRELNVIKSSVLTALIHAARTPKQAPSQRRAQQRNSWQFLD